MPLEQVIFITAPFRLSSVMIRSIPSAIRDGLLIYTQTEHHFTILSHSIKENYLISAKKGKYTMQTLWCNKAYFLMSMPTHCNFK